VCVQLTPHSLPKIWLKNSGQNAVSWTKIIIELMHGMQFAALSANVFL
jgi:hypothetical protein